MWSWIEADAEVVRADLGRCADAPAMGGVCAFCREGALIRRDSCLAKCSTAVGHEGAMGGGGARYVVVGPVTFEQGVRTVRGGPISRLSPCLHRPRSPQPGHPRPSGGVKRRRGRRGEGRQGDGQRVHPSQGADARRVDGCGLRKDVGGVWDSARSAPMGRNSNLAPPDGGAIPFRKR
jgi:hypothetical protein